MMYTHMRIVEFICLKNINRYLVCFSVYNGHERCLDSLASTLHKRLRVSTSLDMADFIHEICFMYSFK